MLRLVLTRSWRDVRGGFEGSDRYNLRGQDAENEGIEPHRFCFGSDSGKGGQGVSVTEGKIQGEQ